MVQEVQARRGEATRDGNLEILASLARTVSEPLAHSVSAPILCVWRGLVCAGAEPARAVVNGWPSEIVPLASGASPVPRA